MDKLFSFMSNYRKRRLKKWLVRQFLRTDTSISMTALTMAYDFMTSKE